MIVGLRLRRRATWPIGAVVAAVLAHAAVLPVRVASRPEAPLPPDLERCRLAGDGDSYPGAGLIDQRFLASDGCRASGSDDLDRDGVLDCWVGDYFGGQGSGGWEVTIHLGCAGDALHTSSSWSRSDNLDAIPVPAGQRGLAIGIGALFHAEPPTFRTSPAMRWRLGTATPTLTPDAPRTYTPEWQHGVPHPESAELLVLDDQLLHARAMAPLALVASCRAFEVWASYEAVAVVDRARHRWSWIHLVEDLQPERPRFEVGVDWPGFQCAGELVFVPRRSLWDRGGDVIVVAPHLARWRSLALADGWEAIDDSATLELYDDATREVRAIPLADLRPWLGGGALPF
jgi:hypothetical protein